MTTVRDPSLSAIEESMFRTIAEAGEVYLTKLSEAYGEKLGALGKLRQFHLVKIYKDKEGFQKVKLEKAGMKLKKGLKIKASPVASTSRKLNKCKDCGKTFTCNGLFYDCGSDFNRLSPADDFSCLCQECFSRKDPRKPENMRCWENMELKR